MRPDDDKSQYRSGRTAKESLNAELKKSNNRLHSKVTLYPQPKEMGGGVHDILEPFNKIISHLVPIKV